MERFIGNRLIFMFRGNTWRSFEERYFLFKDVFLTDIASLKFLPCREYFSAVLSTLRGGGEPIRYVLLWLKLIKIKTDDDSLSEVLSDVLSFFQKIFFEDRVYKFFYP